MSSGPISNVKSNSKPNTDSNRSLPLQIALPKDHSQLSQNKQNKSGLKNEQTPELTRTKEVPLQPVAAIPPTAQPAQPRTFNFITMGRLQLDSTVTRLRICKFILLLIIKALSIPTAFAFWLSVPFCLTTLLTWKAPVNFFYELTLRYLSGSSSTTPIWRQSFPDTDCSNSHHLRLSVHRSSYLHSSIICSTSVPLLVHNHMVWLSVMIFMFLSHHFLCFAHDCLSRVNSTIRPAN